MAEKFKIVDFFAEWYPGVEVHLVDSENDFQLRGRILAVGAQGEGLRLAYPTTHVPPRITDGGEFGNDRGTHFHNGLDLASSHTAWRDKILAALPGRVVVAGEEPSEPWFGVQVRTTMDLGARRVLVRYAHLVEGSVAVAVGDEVWPGQLLGLPDDTGESTGDHLHLDVRVVDPLYPGERLYLDPAILMEWPEEEPQETFNPVGVHGAPVLSPPSPDSWTFWLNELQELGVGTYKLLHSGNPANLDWIRALVGAGIRPVVRLYQAEQFPGRLNPELLDEVPKLAEAGAVDVEIGNEPNLGKVEWKEEYRDQVTWQSHALVEMVAQGWWLDTQAVIEYGGRPAIYAMAPTDRDGVNFHYSSVNWLRRTMEWVAAHHGDEMRALLEEDRVWLAVHSSPFSRPLDFEPGDPPDDMCALGYKVYRQIVFDLFGVWPETISTEGGMYSPEHLSEQLGWDSYSEEAWGVLTVEYYKWLQKQGDLVTCTWVLSDEGIADQRWLKSGWFSKDRQPRAPVFALKDWIRGEK